MMNKLKKYWKKITAGLIVLFIAALAVLAIFINVNTYRAMPEATNLLDRQNVHQEDKWLRVDAENHLSSIVLYQGGLVEEEAYLPLAVRLSEEGFRVFIPSFPLNLAILDVSVFEEIYDAYEEENGWWIGGHSLGGASASIFSADHNDRIDGIIFLAAYPSANSDLSGTNLPVLSITGSDDDILNLSRYREAYGNLPTEAVHEVIEGGNHSNFGYYGFQSGDGDGTISREQQHEEVAALIVQFIRDNQSAE